jgi:sugar O-acyltransferase (sialic acid O-acetyltransferase NeuD family)
VRAIKPLVVYGCGGFGREVALAVTAINRCEPTWDLLGFLDDDPTRQGAKVGGLPVLGGYQVLDEWDRGGIGVVVAIGDRAVHRRLVDRIRQLEHCSFPVIVHPSASLENERVRLGEGTYVGPHATITVDVRVGPFGVVNANSVLAHDVVAGSHVQVNPGAVVGGQVVLGDGVTVGLGAVILPRLRVGAGALVGIGAAVGADVPAGATAVGNPARLVPRKAER